MIDYQDTAGTGPGKILLLAALVLSSSCAPALAQSASYQESTPPPQEERGTIQVTGQAQTTIPADLVRIGFTVETEGETAGAATEENARLMDAVISAVRSLDLPGMDIETYGYSLRPEYQIPREGIGTRTISGYRVENNIRVSLPDVDATGAVLDRAVGAGANRVANLVFEASDTKPARLRALRDAVVNAREQAEAIAEAMGVELGIALEVQGGADAPSPRSPGGIMFRASAEVTTPVEPSDQIVSASVSIKYRIREGGR